MSDNTLLKLCVLKIAHLLKKCYWPAALCNSSSLSEENPFITLPTFIIEDIISTVVQLTPTGTLSVRDLYPILSSGRIKHFKLEDILLPTEELVGILTALCVCGQNLNSLVLRKVYCTDYYATLHNPKMQPLRSSAVECLLSLAPNLEYLQIDIQFDLKTLQKVRSLKRLELNFIRKNSLYDLIPKIDDTEFITNTTLVHVSIYEGPQNAIPYEEIAFLLTHCSELVCFENSIAEALEFLHSDEYYSGTLTHKYKLEKAMLGNAFLTPEQAPAPVISAQIAALTCPFLKELDILLSDHDAVIALCNLQHLNSLLIQWAHIIPGDFRFGVQVLLQHIGQQLKILNIINFSNVDFAAIGTLCPYLVFLKVEYDSEIQAFQQPEICFEGLEMLHVECMDDVGALPETLLLLLSSCNNLESLCLDSKPYLTDEVLKDLLKKNSLSKMKEATILGCALTEEGLKCLVKSCTALDFLHFSSSRIPFERAVVTVHEINPFIIMRSDIE